MTTPVESQLLLALKQYSEVEAKKPQVKEVEDTRNDAGSIIAAVQSLLDEVTRGFQPQLAIIDEEIGFEEIVSQTVADLQELGRNSEGAIDFAELFQRVRNTLGTEMNRFVHEDRGDGQTISVVIFAILCLALCIALTYTGISLNQLLK